MSIRDKRQLEFADKWIEKGKFGILNLCPRMGKTRVAIQIFSKLQPSSILIAYPNHTVKQSWDDEFDKMGYSSVGITFTTHLSLKKHTGKSFDIVVLDEIHLLSEAQIKVCEELFTQNTHVLGLTGTLSSWTERILREDLGLNVVGRYPIEKAIEEGVVTDYEIEVVTTSLDKTTPRRFGKKLKTEKKAFDDLGWVIDRQEIEGKSTVFLRLARMRIIQHSVAKFNKTRETIQLYEKERVVVFCGLTEIADKLGIPSYHSKSSEKDVFNRFANGEGNHLAVVKLGNTGVTYKPLNRVIINYTDSNPENLTQKINRAMSMEYDNPEKKACITIISTNEEVELKWIRKALSFFSKEKIKYI